MARNEKREKRAHQPIVDGRPVAKAFQSQG